MRKGTDETWFYGPGGTWRDLEGHERKRHHYNSFSALAEKRRPEIFIRHQECLLTQKIICFSNELIYEYHLIGL